MTFAPGPPLTATAVRLVLLGSGELGREVAIEAMRLVCEVRAVDRYVGAPAMQVAQRHAVIDMTDRVALRRVLEAARRAPDDGSRTVTRCRRAVRARSRARA